MNKNTCYTLGIDIGSTTVKIALLDEQEQLLFSDYQRHYANIQETLASLINACISQHGNHDVMPVITGSGGLTLANHLKVPFVQEVIAVSTSLKSYAPQTDVAALPPEENYAPVSEEEPAASAPTAPDDDQPEEEE